MAFGLLYPSICDGDLSHRHLVLRKNKEEEERDGDEKEKKDSIFQCCVD